MKDNLKNKTRKDLHSLLLEKRNFLRDFRFRIAKGKTKNVKEGRELRREIARILTKLKRDTK